MKVVCVIPRSDSKESLKSLLKKKERALRGTSTAFSRSREGRWVHVKYPGWINWDEGMGGILLAEIHTKIEGTEWQLLQAFVGYLDRHLGDNIDSITVTYR